MTARDDEILHLLARRVRLATAGQAAQLWWPNQFSGVTSALRRLRQLSTAGWLTECRVLAHPLLDLRAPVVTWSPGDPAPQPHRVSNILQSRWRQAARQLTVFAASMATLRAFGAADRRTIKCHHQVTHDLHVTEVYVQLYASCPELAASWVGEDALGPSGPHHVVPDAILFDADGSPQRAIEFGGRYTADRCIRFHADCAARQLPYEIW